MCEVAARFQCAWPTVKPWAKRYAAGEAMTDRSPRARSSSNKTLKMVAVSSLGFCRGCFIWLRRLLFGGVGSGLFRRGWGVSVLVFFWGVHVDRGMRADGVVPVDPLGRRDLQVVDGVPGALVSDQFGFIQRVECLGERVVVGVALGADQGDGVAVGKGRARNGSRCTGRPDPNGE